MNNSWAFLFALGFAGCAGRIPVVVAPSTDWQADVAGDCRIAGEVLVRNECPEANPKGISWLEFCSKAQASAGAIDLDVGCIASAASLDAVRGCHVRCRR